MNTTLQELAGELTRLLAREPLPSKTLAGTEEKPLREPILSPRPLNALAVAAGAPKSGTLDAAVLSIQAGTPAAGASPGNLAPDAGADGVSLARQTTLKHSLDGNALSGQGASAIPLTESRTVVSDATPGAVQRVDYASKGYHLDATVLPGQVVSAAALLDRHGFTLDTITGVDWIAEGQMEVVYDYFHTGAPARVAVRSRIPRNQPEIPTISEVFAGANWHERETHDFFGIRFLGHPDLSPFLLPEDADYHPLRKDFVA